MTKFNKIVLPAIVSLALGSLASSAWAGDVKGKVVAQGMRSPENIAVYIDSIPGKTFPPPAQHAVMDQHHMAFVPHVLVVLKGTAVDFTNQDPVGHNVYWPAINHNRKLAHNMGTWAQGASKPFTFNDLGDVPLLCNVHPEMSGYIIVVPTPYFALTDKDGSFTIKDVPPGKYTLKTWSEQAKPVTQALTVGAGAATVNLTVKR
ncbi:MAG: carboxypeptidase regulatory-like domain-containing protein [Acidobacteriaceae bacterium]